MHLAATACGAFMEFQGWICPLTPLENYLHQPNGTAGYEATSSTLPLAAALPGASDAVSPDVAGRRGRRDQFPGLLAHRLRGIRHSKKPLNRRGPRETRLHTPMEHPWPSMTSFRPVTGSQNSRGLWPSTSITDSRSTSPTRHDPIVADVHLGKLAKRLRLARFDTAYRDDANGATLADAASLSYAGDPLAGFLDQRPRAARKIGAARRRCRSPRRVRPL